MGSGEVVDRQVVLSNLGGRFLGNWDPQTTSQRTDSLRLDWVGLGALYKMDSLWLQKDYVRVIKIVGAFPCRCETVEGDTGSEIHKTTQREFLNPKP